MRDSEKTVLRLGTRGSLLARTQSGLVARMLEEAHPGLRVELILFKTTGDLITNTPLHAFGGKGLFTKELEQALLDRQVDFAVHSFKDMPTTMPLVDQSDLIVAAVPVREDPRDVLVSERAITIADLAHGAKIGTGSLRRKCQILAMRPDLHVEPIRGNIDTRLRKQAAGEFDAIVLAMAGIRRVGMFDPTIMLSIEPSVLLSAPGQGALALQCRRDDATTRALLAASADANTTACVEAERALVLLLQGDCLSPIGALATVTGDQLHLKCAVGASGGKPPVLFAEGNASIKDPPAAARACFASLELQGVEALLRGVC